MTVKRADVHRRAVIRPEDYEYVGSIYAPQGEVEERYEETAGLLRRSSAAGFRAYRALNRCDHCGAHLKNVTVWLHKPTGGHIAAGETCAKETLRVPDRMVLDLKRLADWRAGVERPRTPEEWKEYRLKEARHTYPETLEFLRAVLDGDLDDEKHAWFRRASGNDRDFVLKLARGHGETGRVSDRVDAVVRRIKAATAETQRRIVAGWKHAPAGRALTVEGVVVSAGEAYDGWKVRHAMVVRGDDGWRVSATIPKSLVMEEHIPTRYELREGDRVRFVAEVQRSYKDPYFGWAKRPKQVEVLGREGVEKTGTAMPGSSSRASRPASPPTKENSRRKA